MRHLIASLSILLCLAACGGGSSGAPAADGAPLGELDAQQTADAEFALLIDLIRALDARDAAELANELVFDLVRFDPDASIDPSDDTPFTETPDIVPGTTRDDGLPAGAPPPGWGFAGFADTGATVTKDPETGAVTKTWQWSTTDARGNETVHTRRDTTGEGGGSSYSTHTTGAVEVIVRRSKSNSGDLTEERTFTTIPEGNGIHRRWIRFADGLVVFGEAPVEDNVVRWDQGDAHPPRAGRPQERPPLWMRDNPGDEGTVWWQQALADWVWQQHRLGRHTPGGVSIPTHGNPEDPDYHGGLPTGPTVWDYVATGDLAINPDPTNPTLAAHPPSGRVAWILREILQGYGQGATPGGSPGSGGGR